MKPENIRIVLSKKKTEPEMVFVEIENQNGESVKIGKSYYDEQGYFCIEINKEDFK